MASRPQAFAAPDNNFFALFFWTALCVGGGMLMGAFFRPDAWFRTLEHPFFAPPNWVFAPVWTILYIMMGVAMWRVERYALSVIRRIRARRAFVTQLVINFSWTAIFFGLHSPVAALAVIVVLWVAVAVTMYLFHRANRGSVWLLAPYLAWVTFAMALNAGYAVLN